MKVGEKELFSVAIRVVGLLSFGRGFFDIVYILFYAFGSLRDQSVTKGFPDTNLTYGVAYILAGLYLLRGAPFVVRFAFPETPGIAESENSENTN